MTLPRVRTEEVKTTVRGRWPEVLVRLGIEPRFLTRKNGPCPGCGGRDRFMFDDQEGRGTWFCRGGGAGRRAGDGFALLDHVYGWSFREALEEVASVVALQPRLDHVPRERRRRDPEELVAKPDRPTPRAWRILRESCHPADVPAAREYLGRRWLWPLPKGCTLRAHPNLPYWIEEEKRELGRFPALVARVDDAEGEFCTVHVTYLWRGDKLDVSAPRKIVGPVRGRAAPAVRLLPAGEEMCIGEGIETSLAGGELLGMACWSALNTSLLMRWSPPEKVRKVVVLVDMDQGGVEAAGALALRLVREQRCEAEMRAAPVGADWHESLEAKRCR